MGGILSNLKLDNCKRRVGLLTRNSRRFASACRTHDCIHPRMKDSTAVKTKDLCFVQWILFFNLFHFWQIATERPYRSYNKTIIIIIPNYRPNYKIIVFKTIILLSREIKCILQRGKNKKENRRKQKTLQYPNRLTWLRAEFPCHKSGKPCPGRWHWRYSECHGNWWSIPERETTGFETWVRSQASSSRRTSSFPWRC